MILPQLHLASMYSFNHGTASPERLVEAAAAEGARIAALTDRDGVSGAVRHIRACLKAGISPVVGVELCARDEAEGPEQPQSITVLAHGRGDGRGWAGLVRLVSAVSGASCVLSVIAVSWVRDRREPGRAAGLPVRRRF